MSSITVTFPQGVSMIKYSVTTNAQFLQRARLSNNQGTHTHEGKGENHELISRAPMLLDSGRFMIVEIFHGNHAADPSQGRLTDDEPTTISRCKQEDELNNKKISVKSEDGWGGREDWDDCIVEFTWD